MRVVAGLVAALVLAAELLAQTPVGGELPVNAFTGGAQSRPGVASLPGGGFVVVWQGAGNYDVQYGVFGHVFDAPAPPWAPTST